MNRKTICCIAPAVLAMLVSCAHGQRFDVESDFSWERLGDGAVIIGYIGASVDVRIPQRIQGLRVIAIGARAFQEGDWEGDVFVMGQHQLASVVIPNRVATIDEAAFAHNRLTSVIIGSRVTSIGDWAFYENQLTYIIIPNRVVHIGYFAFWNNQLADITIGNSVASIGAFAFWNNRLTSVVIPSSVTSIGNGAFSNNNLTSITIGENVAIEGDGGFGYQFVQFYQENERRAGTYTLDDGVWNFQLR